MNILPFRTLQQLGMSQSFLEPENVGISGFNQSNERVMGSIQLLLEIQELKSHARFYVIDADSSYAILLERLPSTLHQCLKYKDAQGNQKKISGCPPWKHSHLTMPKFYVEASTSASLPNTSSKPSKRRFSAVAPPPYNQLNGASCLWDGA